MRFYGLTTFLTIAALLSGCAAAPSHAPEEAVSLTEEYARAPVTSAPDALLAVADTSQPWWTHYNDPALNALMDEALANNPGLNQIRKRMEQAAAAAQRDFSDLLPDATLSGERAVSRGDNAGPSTFSLRGAASYELDIWGGNRASWRAGDLEAQASIEETRAAAITLSASIVENWLTLRSLREEETLLHGQIETNELVLALQHKRYEGGVAAMLDVLQQKEVLERARARLPDIQANIELTEHQISLLAGRNPSVPLDIAGDKLPDILPLPVTGIPAQLLDNRPDIIAAWLKVKSADWAVESARIDRLPAFDLSADFSTASTAFANLFDVWALDLALGLVMPVIDGGQRAAEQARQEALADERFMAYRETVLAAIGDVENALSRNYHQTAKIAAVKDQLAAARNTLEQAQISYANGDSSYIVVLNGLINTQSLEQQLVQERLGLALDRVSLWRAIGLRAWTDRALTAEQKDKTEEPS
ncbi:MAG: efflux transporter outer membrane subunit [Rhodospirillales bacterium]|nr:efflux transporter outer membrane subunit [Rhodospirillales bacterium]